jgi:hypothetical protein
VRTIQHPLSGALYDLTAEGFVQVTTRSGQVGLFDRDGRWQSGDVFQVDPHLCVWIAGRELLNRFQEAASALEAMTQ